MHRAHQAVHSSNADAGAIVTLEDMVDFIGAKAFVIISINSKDKAPEILIKRNTGSGRRIKMLVVSASIDYTSTSSPRFLRQIAAWRFWRSGCCSLSSASFGRACPNVPCPAVSSRPGRFAAYLSGIV